MTNDLYSRQTKLNLKPIGQAIVVGCGGTGFWTALFLAMSGCENITLFDPDTIEETNLNRLPLTKAAISLPKVKAVSQFIESIRPACVVTTVADIARPAVLDETPADILFDCTDSQKTQLELSHYAKGRKIRYIRCGYNGTHFTVNDHVSSWVTGEVADGYTIIPSWACGAALPATIAIAKAELNSDIDVSMDFNDFAPKKEIKSRRISNVKKVLES